MANSIIDFYRKYTESSSFVEKCDSLDKEIARISSDIKKLSDLKTDTQSKAIYGKKLFNLS